jgi:hypothetical protein
MVKLLQVDSVEPGGHEVTLQGHFQGPNCGSVSRNDFTKSKWSWSLSVSKRAYLSSK